MDLEQLEQRIYRSTWEDGLLDLCVGLALALMGAIWFTDAAGMAGIVAALLVPIWFVARKRISEPRVGQVSFSQERRKSEKKLLSGFFVAGLVMLALGVLVYLRARGGQTQDLISVLVPALPAALLALPAIVIGSFLGLGRFIAYGGVLVAAGGLVILLQTGPALSLLVSGLVILLVGIYLLVRFIKTHPVVTPGESS